MLHAGNNGENSFVHHAYFLGGWEPYENLNRALRAEIDEPEWSTLDEPEWSTLYSARSVPVDAPPKKARSQQRSSTTAATRFCRYSRSGSRCAPFFGACGQNGSFWQLQWTPVQV
jgi:hypothetical protein